MILKKAGLNKGGCSHGERVRGQCRGPGEGGLGDGGGSSSLGEAGGLPQFSKRGIWRCLMECKVGGFGP